MTSNLLKSILKRNLGNNNDNIRAYDIFLSYHWKDQVEVIKLHRELVKYYHVWLDLVEIRVGDDLNERIDNAIQNSKLFICCMNNDYLNAHNCRYELVKAQSEKKDIYILPFEKLFINESLMSEYKIKFDNIYELNNIKSGINIDQDISSILKFIFGNNLKYVSIFFINFLNNLTILIFLFCFLKPVSKHNLKKIYNSIPSVQAYRA